MHACNALRGDLSVLHGAMRRFYLCASAAAGTQCCSAYHPHLVASAYAIPLCAIPLCGVISCLLLSHQRIQLTDLPYTVLFMVIYGIFHHYIRYPRTRTLLYFFLSWKFKHAPLILLALLTAVATFFVVGVAVSEVRGEPYGPPLVLMCSVLVMKLREPKVMRS